MKRLEGEDCPPMFGKWRPLKFEDSYDYPEKIQHIYDFGSARVHAHSGDYRKDVHFFICDRRFMPDEYSIEGLFNPIVSEMYKDCREHVLRNLDRARKNRPKMLPRFERTTDFATILERGFEHEIYGRKLDAHERGKVIEKCYLELKEHLRKLFGIENENEKSWFLTATGREGENIRLRNNMVLVTNAELKDEYYEIPKHILNGIRFGLISFEDGNIQEHENTYKECADFLVRNAKEFQLKEVNGNVIEPSGNNSWQVLLEGELDEDLRNAIFGYKLSTPPCCSQPA